MKTRNQLGVFTAALLLTSLIALAEPDKWADKTWKPVEQPQLSAALDAAPELKFQDLADGPDICTEGPIWWVPNPDGQTWDMVFINGLPPQVFIYDTGTQELKKSQCRELTTLGFGFHLNNFFMINGKAYTYGGSGPSSLLVYDPARNEFEFGGYPLGQKNEQNVKGGEALITPNDDGTLFGGFGPLLSNRQQLGFFTIDPVTRKGEFLGAVGPDNPNFAWEYRSIVFDGDWLYARVGHTPWRLYAMNVKSRDGKVLAETERIMGDRSTIHFIRNENYAGLYVGITGLKGGPKDKTQAFWLRDGELTPCEIVPPNTKPVSPRSADRLDRPRPNFVGYQSQITGAPKGFTVERGEPATDGTVRIRYRLGATNAWQTFQFQLEFSPTPIRRLAALADGSIFAVGESYGRAVSFDPKSGTRKPLGQTMSVYSLLPVEKQIYICGYPSSQLWVYDPAQPWTDGPTGETNPSRLAMLKEFTDVHIPWAAAVGGDGRVYFGGKVVRIGNGGGLGWWDAREHKAGGLSKPFDNYTVFWMCSADNGRYILCSTKPVAGRTNPDYTPPRGRLFVYDTTKHELTQPIDDERLEKFPGYIVEALPGLVMGYTPAKGGQEGLLYGFDPAAGKVLWTKPVPRAPETSFSVTRKGKYCFVKGPDGFIWAGMEGVLVRINPQTAEVVPVGKMEDNPIAFLDGDVYVAGSAKFRKIAGLPKVTPAR